MDQDKTLQEVLQNHEVVKKTAGELVQKGHSIGKAISDFIDFIFD
jgi:hypothetical protein